MSLGSAFEHRVKDALEAAGWFVVRAAGSHGVADLIAIGPSLTICTFHGDAVRTGPRVIMVQCKRGYQCPPDEWNGLYDAAAKYDAAPVLAYKVKRGVIGWKRMVGRKSGVKGTRAPAEDWTP